MDLIGQSEDHISLDIAIESGMRSRGDSKLLSLLYRILFDNAIKYSHQGQRPRIEAGEADGVFFVKNEGIGFENQYAERIFRPFERLHRDEDYPGTGIGLANAKRVVERHGGHLWGIGEPGKSATFYFTLSGSEDGGLT